MQFKVFVSLTFNVLTCIKRTNGHKSINRYISFTHMCRAGFADGIQFITVFATFDFFLLKTYQKYLKYMLFGIVFLTN